MDYNEIFTSILLEAPGELPDDADLDAQALQQKLSPDDRAGYDVEGLESSDADTAKMIKGKAEHWSNQLDSFIAWINGTDGQSLLGQVQLAQKNPGFEGIGDQTQREIVKAAAGLAALRQRINGFINTADSKIAKAMEG